VGGKPDGTEGGACYGNGTCNAGLTCLSKLCVMPPKGGDGCGCGLGGSSGGSALPLIAFAFAIAFTRARRRQGRRPFFRQHRPLLIERRSRRISARRTGATC
jgi:hypothetical protein